jgi:asparagine synthase (glutamine-hydrolysing)
MMDFAGNMGLQEGRIVLSRRWEESQTPSPVIALPEGMELSGYVYPASRAGLQKVTDRTTLLSWLQKARGSFCGIWHDEASGEVHLFTDRLGWKPLYYSTKEYLSWATRLQYFKNLFPLVVNPESLEAFLYIGFLPGDMTWFEGVNRMPAASLWTYDPGQAEWRKDRYWDWGKIRQREISFDQAVEAFVEQLRESVYACLPETGQIGVSLSGGMDSRCLLAIAGEARSLEAYIFSDYRSLDLDIAQRVVKKAGVPFQHLVMDNAYWMGGREEAIWRSEGMKGLLHLHHVPMAGVFAGIADWNLNGFLGGIALGGIYASEAGPQKRQSIAQRELGHWGEQFSPEDSFYAGNLEAWYIDQRSRRFSLEGVWEWDRTQRQLIPFADFLLIEFLYSLPLAYRKNYRLFHEAMVRYYPDLFRDIPWHRSGFPLKYRQLNRWSTQFRLPQIFQRLGIWRHYQYTNYPEWMRDEEWVAAWKRWLGSESAAYRAYTDRDLAKEFLEPFLARQRGREEELSRALTVAIWLEKVRERLLLD